MVNGSNIFKWRTFMLILMQPLGLTAFVGASINDHDILISLTSFSIHTCTLWPGERQRKCKAIQINFVGSPLMLPCSALSASGSELPMSKAYSPAGICSLLPGSKHVCNLWMLPRHVFSKHWREVKIQPWTAQMLRKPILLWSKHYMSNT